MEKHISCTPESEKQKLLASIFTLVGTPAHAFIAEFLTEFDDTTALRLYLETSIKQVLDFANAVVVEQNQKKHQALFNALSQKLGVYSCTLALHEDKPWDDGDPFSGYFISTGFTHPVRAADSASLASCPRLVST